MIVTKTVFDLNTFGYVQLGKEFEPSPDFTSLAAALSFYGNDEAKVLAALNQDKVSRETKLAEDAPISEFHTYAVDEEGEPTDKLNGLAGDSVTPVSEKLVNDLVLNIAKQHFGFAKGIGPDKKKEAKEKALTFVQGQPALKSYLQLMSGAALLVVQTPAAE